MNIFIISWVGQHENASLIAEQIFNTSAKVSIVYSDPDPKFKFNLACNLIRRSNDLFWEDKFKKCLDITGDDGMLVIHADCKCDDWSFLVRRCGDITQSVKDIGVWSPQIDWSPYHVNVSGIAKINNSGLVLSALTDGIVFYLSPDIIERMRKVSYGNNKFGWGIDSLFCATAHINNKLVVIDSAVKVLHPQNRRGYDGHAALLQKNELLKQFSLRERVQYELLQSHVRYNRAKINAQSRKNSQLS